MTANQLRYNELLENKRHNVAGEAHNTATLAETNRHNLVSEGISLDTLNETKRSNIAKELETNRSNIAKETETRRANTVKEAETHRSNVAQESETHRSNVANETIKLGTLDETKRSNVANESIRAGTLEETKRSNLVGESHNWQQLQLNSRTLANQQAQTRIQQRNADTNALNAKTNAARADLEERSFNYQTYGWENPDSATYVNVYNPYSNELFTFTTEDKINGVVPVDPYAGANVAWAYQLANLEASAANKAANTGKQYVDSASRMMNWFKSPK